MWSRGIKYKRNFRRKFKHKQYNLFNTYPIFCVSIEGIRLKNDRIRDLKWYKSYYNRYLRRIPINLDDVGLKGNYYLRYYKSKVWDIIY